MKNVLIEGWRGICQSNALVNQYQLLELTRSPRLSLYHSDLPYLFPYWADSENNSGFSPELSQLIMAVPKPSMKEFDTVYRIGFPYVRSSVSAKRLITFIVTEFGVLKESFASGETAVSRFCSGNDLITTPSNWSKMKLLEGGFPSEKVHVVPHGVNSDIFFPLLDKERQSIRHELNISDEHFVFLNVSALTPNKGVDCLISAFSIVRQRYANARLILKDTSGLYGHTVVDFIRNHVQRDGPLSPEVMESIYQVPSSLPLTEMRLLYGAADVYVSPYRAEGFNLPVIEAIACGTPVIVTEGGATDDFCDSNTSLMIKSDRVANADCGSPVLGYHLGPRQESLVEHMEMALTGNMASRDTFEHGRQQLIDKFSWASVADQLEAIF